MAKTHTQIQSDMQDKVLDLLRDGEYKLPNDEWMELYGQTLFVFYDDLVETLNMAAVPIGFDARQRRIFILPEFMQQANPKALQKYARLLRKRYDAYMASFEEGDGQGKTFETGPDFGLSLHIGNETYSQAVLNRMLFLPYEENNIDGYGWIESRRSRFYARLDFLCEHYALPRLPVRFHESGQPYFHATDREVNTFIRLLHRRKKEQDFLLEQVEQRNDIETDALLNKCDEDDEEEIDAIYEKQDDIVDRKQSQIETQLITQWHLENTKYAFPSQLDQYNWEHVNTFLGNNEYFPEQAEMLCLDELSDEKNALFEHEPENNYSIDDDRVFDLIMMGECQIPDNRWMITSEQEFRDLYQEILDRLSMPYLPLVFDRDKKTFSISPAFMDNADPDHLEQYQAIFVSRYEEVYEKDSDREWPVDYEDEMPELPYRVHNDDYANTILAQMVMMPYSQNSFDSYGWIENRKTALFNEMTQLSQNYCLPKLPIVFDDADALPRFNATPREVRLFIDLFHERYKSEKQQIAIEKRFQEEYSLAAIGLSDNDVLNLEKQYRDRMNKALEEFTDQMQTLWNVQNRTYTFPSAVKTYCAESLNFFKKNFYRLDDEESETPLNDLRPFKGAESYTTLKLDALILN